MCVIAVVVIIMCSFGCVVFICKYMFVFIFVCCSSLSIRLHMIANDMDQVKIIEIRIGIHRYQFLIFFFSRISSLTLRNQYLYTDTQISDWFLYLTMAHTKTKWIQNATINLDLLFVSVSEIIISSQHLLIVENGAKIFLLFLFYSFFLILIFVFSPLFIHSPLRSDSNNFFHLNNVTISNICRPGN